MSESRLVVNLTQGTIICDQVTIADRPLRRMRGLLGRGSLAAGEGMLLQPAPSIHTAFMRFAIDAVFMDGTLRVMKVVQDLKPWRAASAYRGRTILELAAGQATVRGIKVGDQLGVVEITDHVGLFMSTTESLDPNRSEDGLRRGDGQHGSGLQVVNGSSSSDLNSAPGLPETVHVLLVGTDRRFRSVAGALLTWRGYRVTLADRSSNLAELAKRESADVVLFDAGSSLTEGARAAAQIEATYPTVGLVMVGDDAENSLSTMRVLAKWDSFDQLYEAIEQAPVQPARRYSRGSRR